MGMQISFTVPGRISGKGRPKFARRGKFVATYTPEKTRSMEGVVRHFADQAMGGGPLLEGALHLDVLVSLNRPVSWSKRKRAENPFPTGRPDLDNIGKLVSDAMNGVVFQDDSQIASLYIGRRFKDGEAEGATITVRELRADLEAI